MCFPWAHSLDDSATGASVAELYSTSRNPAHPVGALLIGPLAEKLREKGLLGWLAGRVHRATSNSFYSDEGGTWK